MAYSPIEQGRVLGYSKLKDIAARHNAMPAQVALAWLLRQHGVVTIPKAANVAHVRENRAVLELHLTIEISPRSTALSPTHRGDTVGNAVTASRHPGSSELIPIKVIKRISPSCKSDEHDQTGKSPSRQAPAGFALATGALVGNRPT
jgi:hypothetical protein